MPSRVTFVLNEPRNPKNIGAAARGMANFGFRRLVVVNPYAPAWRETRSAVKAADVVMAAKKQSSLAAALKGAHVVIGTSAGSRRTRSARWIGLDEARSLVRAAEKAKKKAVLLFGSERFGLSNEDLAQCHYILRIPTAADCPSMNLSQAVAVVACALRKDDAPAPPDVALPGVTTAHLEKLIQRGLAAYNAAGLHKGWDPRRAEDRIRTAFYRWNLTDVDVQMLHGLFGWVIRKAD